MKELRGLGGGPNRRSESVIASRADRQVFTFNRRNNHVFRGFKRVSMATISQVILLTL
jgi:hypothetical protein